MKKNEFKGKISKTECVLYNKTILNQIGIRRMVYDVITKGDIHDDIIYISKMNTQQDDDKKIELDIKNTIKQILKFYKDKILMVSILDICVIDSTGMKSSNRQMWSLYKKILTSLGFINIYFGTEIDGHMKGSYMVYMNDTSKKFIHTMVNKGLIVSFSK